MRLHGRRTECTALDTCVAVARAGDSQTMVLRGEAGIGKTALLDHVAGGSTDCWVLRAVGIESEMELPFAAVHQLVQPLLEGLERLPPPQRGALETAFGLTSGEPPDRFFVGLALLSLLSAQAEGRPVVCLVDDAQWLDRSSAQVLAFVARRLHAESVAIVVAERDGDAPSEFEGLPELRLRGLSEEDAAALVTSSTLGPAGQVGARTHHRRGTWKSARPARAPARAILLRPGRRLLRRCQAAPAQPNRGELPAPDRPAPQ